jgi:N-acyl homoserine lactone hydrolase
MLSYSIYPIAVCEGEHDGSYYSYRANFGLTFKNAVYAWFIKGSGPKILVDTGAKGSTFRERGAAEIDLSTMEDGLAKLGLTPADIDIVILTHLHGDHTELGSIYKNAKFIVQKRELEYARHPHPIDADLYVKSYFEPLNLDIIDGDVKINSGISVFLSPGHTPGGQSVEINTKSSGIAIIPGFCSSLDTFKQTEEMKRRGWDVSAPLLHNDVREVYDSALKIKRKADIILPLHAPDFIATEVIP